MPSRDEPLPASLISGLPLLDLPLSSFPENGEREYLCRMILSASQGRMSDFECHLAEFLRSDKSQSMMRRLFKHQSMAAAGSLVYWFELCGWVVRKRPHKKFLFRGALRLLEAGAELGILSAHKCLEQLVPRLLDLLERGRISPASKIEALKGITLMLDRNEKARSRNLVAYAAKIRRLMRNPSIPWTLRSLLIESLFKVFSSTRLPLPELDLECQILRAIRPNLLNILKDRAPHTLKVLVLRLVNRILYMRMMDGKVRLPVNTLSETYAKIACSRGAQRSHNAALDGCFLLRDQDPHLLLLLQRRLRAASRSLTLAIRFRNDKACRTALETVQNLARLTIMGTDSTNSDIFITIASLLSRPCEREITRLSLDILASPAYRNQTFGNHEAKIQSKITRIVIRSRHDPALRHKAVEVLNSRWEPSLRGPMVVLDDAPRNEISLETLFLKVRGCTLSRIGKRSLLIELTDARHECVYIKTVPREEDLPYLLREAFWIKHLTSLRKKRIWGETRFDPPRLLDFGESPAFVLRASSLFPGEDSRGIRPAIGLRVHREYFDYVNSPLSDLRSPIDVPEVLARGAYLLGILCSRGIVHTDIIPLFHRSLRRPPTPFLWWQGGKIANWPASCRYPNLGPTGLRDFEHFISWGNDPPPAGHSGPGSLYRCIGGHLLSLILLVGSSYRNQANAYRGSVPNGDPLRFRFLFKPVALRKVLRAVIGSYYRGLVGDEFPAWNAIDIDRLGATIEETMGQDLCLGSVFRKEDQKTFSTREFTKMLRASGYSFRSLAALKKGSHDLFLIDGPNLERNSIPGLPIEIRDAVETSAVICVIGLLQRHGSFGVERSE